MTIQQAIQSIRSELQNGEVRSEVSVELNVVLHENGDDSPTIECLHSRSRRTDHTHKLRFSLTSQANKPQPSAPPAASPKKIREPDLTDQVKAQIDAAEPKFKIPPKSSPPPLRRRDSRL